MSDEEFRKMVEMLKAASLGNPEVIWLSPDEVIRIQSEMIAEGMRLAPHPPVLGRPTTEAERARVEIAELERLAKLESE